MSKILTASPGDSGYTVGLNASEPVGFHGALSQLRGGAAQAALDDETGGGTDDSTLGACGDTSATDQSGVINDNFAKLAVLVNELRAAAVAKGIILGS